MTLLLGDCRDPSCMMPPSHTGLIMAGRSSGTGKDAVRGKRLLVGCRGCTTHFKPWRIVTQMKGKNWGSLEMPAQHAWVWLICGCPEALLSDGKELSCGSCSSSYNSSSRKSLPSASPSQYRPSSTVKNLPWFLSSMQHFISDSSEPISAAVYHENCRAVHLSPTPAPCISYFLSTVIDMCGCGLSFCAPLPCASSFFFSISLSLSQWMLYICEPGQKTRKLILRTD